MITGEMDEMDEAIPAAVYFTVTREHVIPIKDPNTDPNIITFKALVASVLFPAIT